MTALARLATTGLVTASLAAAAVLPGTGPEAAPSRTSKTIATATVHDFRVVVTAIRGSGGGAAPPATVEIAGYRRAGGGWRSLGRLQVGPASGFFWEVVTYRRSVRRFSVSDTVPERVSLQLLITPSVGWSPVYRFHVEGGRLVRG